MILVQGSGSAEAVELNKIVLIHSDTTAPQVFAKSSAGLDSALAAASSGDAIYIPSGSISGNHTIPSGVNLAGWKGAQLTGIITANPGATVSEELEIANLRWWEAPPLGPRGTITHISGTTITVTNDSSNNSFPALTKMADGSLILLYRVGTDHADSKGVIVKRTSSDGGATWSSATTIISDATYDVRDPGILRTSTDRLVVSYKLSDHTVPEVNPDGHQVVYSDDNGSTWSSPYTINSSFTNYSGCSAPPVELPDGTLLQAVFGQNTGDTYDSVQLFFSTDDGATWGAEQLVADGEADSRHYQEPNIVILPTGELLMLMRSDTPTKANGQFWRMRSRDGGLTWETPEAVFDASGNPHMLQTKQGILAVFYRNRSTEVVEMRTSADNGYSWSEAVIIDGSSMRMTYASPWEYEDGLIGLAYGKEGAADDTNADILFTRLYITYETGQIALNAPTGVAPLTVTSTTVVTNLNADQVDGQHFGALTDWTPTLTQSGSVTMTINYAKYCTFGPLLYVCAKLSVTGSGTAGNDIIIAGMPSNPATDGAYGSIWINDSGTDFKSGTLIYSVGNAGLSLRAHLETNDAGSDPSFALASGDAIWFSATYPV